MKVPSIPIVTNDPYFSIWCNADHLTDTDTSHWTGQKKKIRIMACIDNTCYRLLGLGDSLAAEQVSLDVYATRTIATLCIEGVEFTIIFCSPMLLDKPDIFSVPASCIQVVAKHTEGKKVSCYFDIYDDFCFDGEDRPELLFNQYTSGPYHISFIGQSNQKLLCHAGDHVTIDWGYLYLASRNEMVFSVDHFSMKAELNEEQTCSLWLGYDDVVSINYFGYLANSWYARDGKSLSDALIELMNNEEAILSQCENFDQQLIKEATNIGGDDYAFITSVVYREATAAVKLIADKNGNMVYLTKENDSNGCIGTTDVAFPCSPLFLRYNPELISAMLRPLFRFAHMPVWEFDFAPHDLGRYPYATGEIYMRNGTSFTEQLGHNWDNVTNVIPPIYQYPAGTDILNTKWRMPVEECGNMLILSYAALKFGADTTLFFDNIDLLQKWCVYLEKTGIDPENQLCSEDFTGESAHNVNLSAKIVVGIACYAKICEKLGKIDEFMKYSELAKTFCQEWVSRAGSNGTYLTFDGGGWSMKYNLIWDILLDLNLLPADWYQHETATYLQHVDKYGLPFDCREKYTNPNINIWAGVLASDYEYLYKMSKLVADFIRETPDRVPVSDWYRTETAKHIRMYARPVNGGIFAGLLSKHN